MAVLIDREMAHPIVIVKGFDGSPPVIVNRVIVTRRLRISSGHRASYWLLQAQPLLH
jgi:hypothetical protein